MKSQTMSVEIQHLNWAKAQSPVPVRKLVELLDIRLDAFPMDASQSAFIKKHKDGSFTIGVNTFEGDQRQRFSIAHELGHYFLHRDLLPAGGVHADRLFGGGINPSGVLKPSHETQANQFAADLLMPKEQFLSLWDAHNKNESIRNIAAALDVSRQAARWRAINLDLASREDLNLVN